MSCEHSVHIRLQAKVSVDTALVKLDLHKAVGVGSNDKVDLGPINHDNLFDVVYDVRKLGLCHSLHASVHLCRFELAVQNFIFFNPFGPKDVFFANLIGIVKAKEWGHKLFERCIIQEAILEPP